MLAVGLVATATAVAVTPAAPATPAAVDAILPPPGQYRLDIDGTIAYPDGARVSTRQSGAGAVTVAGTQPGRAPGARTFQNPAPRTICLPPRTASAGFDPMALAGRNGCKGGATMSGADTVTFMGQCQGIATTTVVRKLNAAWEMKTHVDVRGGAQPMPDLARQRKTLEWAAAHAADATTRANARKSLDDWPAYEADMRRMTKEAGPAGIPVMPMRHDATVRLTRVAETCRP